MNVFARTALASIVLLFLLAAPTATAHGGAHQASSLLPAGITQSLVAPDEPAGSSSPGADRDDLGYRLYFKCPPAVQNTVAGSINVDETRCPFDIPDPVDIMGQPVLLIDPKNVDYAAFNALHGGQGVPPPGQEPPTNQSRDNLLHQTHTTFYTFNGHAAAQWNDNPYYSPLKPPPDRSNLEGDPLAFLGLDPLRKEPVYGVDNGAVLDAEGRVYLASLYAFRNESMVKWGYAIGLWKSSRVNQAVDYSSGNIIKKFPEGVVLDSIHAIYVKATNRVVVIWRETDEKNPLQSYINLTWTEPGKGGLWNGLRAQERIGPCNGITNPVALHTKIYIGCFAGKGYRYANGTAENVAHIHTFDTTRDRYQAAYVDQTTIQAPKGQRPNGILVHLYESRIALLSASPTNRGTASLVVAYSDTYEAARYWSEPHDYSEHVNKAPPSGDLIRPAGALVSEARVQGAAFVLRSGNIHLIYMERYKYPNAENGQSRGPEFTKSVISVHNGGEVFLDLVPLGVDLGHDPSRPGQDAAGACQVFEARYQGVGKDVFNDLHDSIVIWANKAGHQREFIAFGDCGNVRFAEILEEDFAAWAPPLPPGTPPIPLAVAGANPAQVGTIAGALAGAMVLRMLAFKRRLAVEAPA